MMKLKIVATTKVFTNIGSNEMPLWKPIGAKEYIVARIDHEPTWKEVGEIISSFMHMIEGLVSLDSVEVYSGFEIYNDASLTHSENFQLQQTANIDFPAQDITEIDVADQISGIKGI